MVKLWVSMAEAEAAAHWACHQDSARRAVTTTGSSSGSWAMRC